MAEEKEISLYAVYITLVPFIIFIAIYILHQIGYYNLTQDFIFLLFILTVIPFVLALISYFKKLGR